VLVGPSSPTDRSLGSLRRLGPFRDWADIEAWATAIAENLQSADTST
jgi:hypothetical protein